MTAPEIVDDREAMQRERSRRYAEAIAAATGADARIKELTEKLEEAEYMRRIAEDEAGAASWLDDTRTESWASVIDTHVYHAGDPEPPDDREYLFSLADGTIMRALRWGPKDNPGERRGWSTLHYESNTIGDWGAALEHAPLLAFTKDTDYGLDRLAFLVERQIEEESQLSRRLPRVPDARTYDRSSLPDRLTVLEHQHLDQLVTLRDKLSEAQRAHHAVVHHAARFATAVENDDPTLLREALDQWNARGES